MIIDFDDICWSHADVEWKRSLVDLLALLANRPQHAVLAVPDLMLPWCCEHLALHVDYFKTRIASAQARANALKIQITPSGQSAVNVPPPWALTARAAYEVVNQPLRMVLENDQSDRIFVESTVPSFASWCQKGWVEPVMGGGSEMGKKILASGADLTARWRTFYLFDSDRLHPTELHATWAPPGGDGCQGYVFEQACTQMPPERWHRLDRRSIENYLPQAILAARNAATSTALFDVQVGVMAHFYNFKKGLGGDGVHPIAPNKQIRAARSQGFWTSLPMSNVNALQTGFGTNVAEEFNNVASNHVWSSDIVSEMNDLGDAIQDAI